MKSEPVLIIEAVRAVLILLAAFGLVLTPEQNTAIIGALVALLALGSAGLAWWNRQRVYAPATVQRIANHAAATGQPSIGDPPKGIDPVE